MPKIEWEPTRYSGATGKINGVHLFSISYTTDRKDSEAGTPWILRHALPFRTIRERFPSSDGAKEYALRYLVAKMAHIGFKPENEVG